jgi:iron complex transport system substrate-binding protein
MKIPMKKSRIQITVIVLALVVVLAAIAGCTGTHPAQNSLKTIQPTAPAVPAAPASLTVPSSTAVSITAVPNGSSTCTPVTISQTDGKDVTLPCMPKRIIATNSDAAEMLIALGAADTIVGVVETTKNVSYIMEKIPKAQSIGDWQTPNIERMLALKPDAVISYASSKPKNLDQINAANITIIYLDCYRLPKLAQDARAVGTLTGHGERAEEYAGLVENTTTTVMNRARAVPLNEQPEVYFEGYSDFTAAGTGSGSDELLMMAGGKNIASSLSGSSPKVSAEWVVAQKPAFVLKAIPAKETRPYKEIVTTLSKRTGWDTVPAVQKDHVYLYNSGILYGPKSYIGLAYTAKILHPDLFGDLDPHRMLDEYAGKYVSGTNTTTTVYPEPA